jgi:hypothetical protein
MRLMTAVLIDEHVHEKVFNDRISELLALFDIYPISLFTSIREEQGLNMEAVYPVYLSRKDWYWTNSFYRTMIIL